MAINKSYHMIFKGETEGDSTQKERQKETEESPQDTLQWLLNLQPMQ